MIDMKPSWKFWVWSAPFERFNLKSLYKREEIMVFLLTA
jgi:hypothetical protein